MIGYLNQFEQTAIAPHLIDRVKNESDFQIIQNLMDICDAKIDLGMSFVKYLMNERLWFLQEMKNTETQFFAIVEELKNLSLIDDNEKLKSVDLIEKQERMNRCHVKYQEIFERINKQLNIKRKDLIYQDNWRSVIQEKYRGNQFLKEIFHLNLKQSALNFHQYLKRKNLKLKQIINNDVEGKALNQVNDDIIIQYIEQIELFQYEIEQKLVIETEVLCYLWIEDMILQQHKYEEIIAIQRAFQINYYSAHIMINLEMQQFNLAQNQIYNFFNEIRQNISLIVLPAKDIQIKNQNLKIQTDCFNKINQTDIIIKKLIQDVINFKNVQFLVIFYQLSTENKNSAENEGDFTQEQINNKYIYQGATLVQGEEVNILKNYRHNQINLIIKNLEDCQIQINALILLINKINELWIAQKKYYSAYNQYDQCALYLKQIQTFSNDQKIIELYTQIIPQTQKLQKYNNQLSYLLSLILGLFGMLPHISEFIVQMEVLLSQSQILVEMLLKCKPQTIQNDQGKDQQSYVKQQKKIKSNDQISQKFTNDDDFEDMLEHQGFDDVKIEQVE